MAEIVKGLSSKDLFDFEQFRERLDKASLEELTELNDDGLNCLHLAASLGLVRHVQAIVDRVNADFLDRTSEREGMTALMYTIASGPNGHPEIVGVLLKAGASHLIQSKDGKTALHMACESGQDDTIELLLTSAANPNTQERTKGRTPLHSSIENGQFNSVQLLCTLSSIPVDLRTWDKDGLTVLHYAAVTQGNAALYIRYLVDKCGLNVFTKSRHGQTAREYAQKQDRFKFHRVIKLFRELESAAKVRPVLNEVQMGRRPLIENMPLSVAIAVLLGVLAFVIDKLLSGESQDL